MADAMRCALVNAAGLAWSWSHATRAPAVHRRVSLLTSPTEDLGKLLACLHGLQPRGPSQFVTGIKTAMVRYGISAAVVARAVCSVCPPRVRARAHGAGCGRSGLR